jgi:transcriptional regulator with XRE-family HTH domain
MAQLKDQFQEFVSDTNRRRLYEREALALEASELVSQLMQQQRISKTELAARVGTSKSHITSLLSGSRNMTMHTLADLTFALGYKVELKASAQGRRAPQPRGGQTAHQKPIRSGLLGPSRSRPLRSGLIASRAEKS